MPILSHTLSPKGLARTAGTLYLLIAVAGGFAIGYLPTLLIVSGDAVATANALAGNIGLARFGLFAEIVVMLAEIGLTALLYFLLAPVSPLLSRTAAWSRLAMVVIMGVNITLSALAFHLVETAALPADAAESVSLLLQARHLGTEVWGLFFALHLMLLGILIFAAPYFPNAFGLLIGAGSLGYLFESLGVLVLPGNGIVGTLAALFLGVSMLGEIGFAFYLLIRGLNQSGWDASTV